MKCCINGGNVIRLLFLSAKVLKFEIQKCGQILCAHKPYFLMPGHISPQQFCDALSLCYNRSLVLMPPTCDGCGATFTLSHALNCQRGGLI